MKTVPCYLFTNSLLGGTMASTSTMKTSLTHPRVGVGVLLQKEGKILLGLRKGSHGAQTWAPAGGHLEFGETVEECARRELLEETGVTAISCRLGPWVENVLDNGTKHYITLFVIVDQYEGELQLLEPDKCECWQWFRWDALPSPLFAPLSSYIKSLSTLTAQAMAGSNAE